MNPVVPIDELRALARAVALDGDLEVHVGDPGSGWHIQPSTGIINVDGADVVRGPADDVRGLVCHEAAHAAVTRYLHIVPRDILRITGVSSLLNSLEDCRIEDWLAARFPGTEPWIALYNDRLFPADGRGLETQPWFSQYCLGAIHEWWYGELPPSLHPEPRAALEATRAARAAYVALQPPIEAEVDLDVAAAYAKSRVAGLFLSADLFAPPDGFERVVRVTAYEAWRIVWQEIRTTYLDLISRDLQHQARMKEHEAAFLQRLGELRNAAPLGRSRRRVRVAADARGLPAWAGPPATPSGGADHVGDLPPELREAMRQAVDVPPANVYEAARRDVAALADRLFQELERVLRPESYPRWVRGFPSGSRLDIRTAMTFDAEPGAYLRLWERKTLPRKRDPSFLLLLDLSGSMSGERIHHGFRGAVLVAEVLERLGIPFAVLGFQDVLVPFKDFADPLDGGMREKMGGMPAEVQGGRRGGHNRPEHNWDGPVLLAAHERLLDRPAGTRILIVMSDGEPSGPSDAEAALHRAVRKIQQTSDVLLIGIGIGPNTEHVAKYYPHHHANVPLEALPVALGSTIDALLRR